MEPFILEWLNLVIRVAHVVAGIMWIGDSFLFMWMDSHLTKPEKPREGDVVGELWMTHSGGFYEVVKRKSLSALPPTLYWFKWESYATFITGFFLITVVFYLGGPAMLVDAGSPLGHGAAVALSLGLLLGGVVLYHLVCATPLIANVQLFGVLALLSFMGLAYALGMVFSPRAVFLQIGAMMGTIMSSNVLLRIIPSQKEMLAATREGRPVDTSFGARAKQRSVHNHYATLPVLFTMVSNHLPGVYGHSQAWLVLGLVFLFAVGVKYFMNLRAETPPVYLAGTFAALVAVVVLTAPVNQAASMDALANGPTVSFATVQDIVQARCTACHAAHPVNPSFAAPPMGVMLETGEQIHAQAGRILVRAVHTKTMPLGNLTGITDQERSFLGAWIAQGAHVDAAGPSQVNPSAAPVPAPVAAPANETPAQAAKTLFTTRCVMCHGEKGAGDGVAGAALTPKPRNFSDKAWQAATGDDAIKKAILEGGAAVGKSALMPPNPDLVQKPEVLVELVKHLRSLAQ